MRTDSEILRHTTHKTEYNEFIISDIKLTVNSMCEITVCNIPLNVASKFRLADKVKLETT